MQGSTALSWKAEAFRAVAIKILAELHVALSFKMIYSEYWYMPDLPNRIHRGLVLSPKNRGSLQQNQDLDDHRGHLHQVAQMRGLVLSITSNSAMGSTARP